MLKTLDNSLNILKYFTRERPQWGVRELAKEAGMNHTVVYRILATFEQHGFLVQDPVTGKYELGLKLLEYGLILRDNLRINDIMYPVMKKMAEEIKESIFLTWLDGQGAICVEILETSRKIKYAVDVGSRMPLYLGASNKVIMAYLPIEAQQDIITNGIRSKTKITVTGKTLLAELQKIKADGWAYSTGEYSEATFGIGVPLFGRDNQILASLAVVGPEFRMPVENVQATLRLLQQGQQEIQQLINRYDLKKPF
jgi:DNA-binding IclR family transcriptional regulator